MNAKIKKVVISSMLASLVCVATMIIKVPTFNGYVNIGDSIVLLCGCILPMPYAFFAAGIGSALADVLSSYVVYAPVTFVIKGLMALILCYAKKKGKSFGKLVLFAILCEILMVVGYYVFEGLVYGFLPSLANVLPNAAQAVVSIVLWAVLVKVFEKYKITSEVK